MLTHILLLIVGMALVIGGGNYVTNGAVAIANKFKLSPLLIGMTVVAFGSSTPDLVVSLFSTIHGKSDLAVGNILGAVIFDMLLVVGIMALMKPMKFGKGTMKIDIPMMIVGALILLFCSQTKVFDVHGVDGISRWEGLGMLAFFAYYFYYTIKTARCPDNTSACPVKDNQKAPTPPKPLKMWVAIVFVAGGLAALVFGGQWTVNAASYIARKAGMSEALIGLTIVGIGSSLPDLATSVIAAIKGQNALALGNIVGSCVMDILFVVGTCAVVRPLNLVGISVVDFTVLLLSAILLFALGYYSKNNVVGKKSGLLLVMLYVAYVTYLVFSH